MVRPKPTIWLIENVDLVTRRKIKAYADLNGIKIAEALTHLVERDPDEMTRRKIEAYAATNGIEYNEALRRLVDSVLANDPAK